MKVVIGYRGYTETVKWYYGYFGNVQCCLFLSDISRFGAILTEGCVGNRARWPDRREGRRRLPAGSRPGRAGYGTARASAVQVDGPALLAGVTGGEQPWPDRLGEQLGRL